MMDLFTDLFTPTAMIRAVEKMNFVPSMLSELYESEPLYGTTFVIDEAADDLAEEITSTPRGTPSKAATLAKGKAHTFETAHFRKDGSVTADEVLNVRAPGQAGVRDNIESRRNRLLAKLARDIDLTLETVRVATLNTPTNSLGTAPASAVVGFGASDTAIRTAMHNNIILPIENALDGIPYSTPVAYCSNAFWVGFIESKTVKETYQYAMQAAELRGRPADAFEYGGVLWKRYRGKSNATIAAGTAKVVPGGVPGLFIQAFAPADTLDQVGKPGGAVYFQSEPLPGNRGWYVEAQTNVACVCTRPASVLTLTLT